MSAPGPDPHVVISVEELREIRGDIKALSESVRGEIAGLAGQMQAFMLQQSPLVARLLERINAAERDLKQLRRDQEREVGEIRADIVIERQLRAQARGVAITALVGAVVALLTAVLPLLVHH
jgi:t-SNARE complex subunit (syntaxin)